MAFLAKRFEYNGKSSDTDFGLAICSFDDNTQSEADTHLRMEPIYTETLSSAYRVDYGAKYADVLAPSCSVVHTDGSDFTTAQKRDFLKWLTGSRELKWLRIIGYDYPEFDEDEAANILCRITNVLEQKIGDRTVGFTIEWTANSPYAFSDIVEISEEITGESTIEIDNDGDESFDYVYPVITFENSQAEGSLSIENATTNKTLSIENLGENEIITIDNLNQIITTDSTYRVFGDDFNRVWFKLAPGENTVSVTGNGSINIKYRLPLKVGEF